MDWLVLGIAGAVVALMVALSGKKQQPQPPTTGEGEQGAEPPYVPPPPATVKLPTPPAKESRPPFGGVTIVVPDPPDIPVVEIVVGPEPDPIPPSGPGSSPSNPVGSKSLFNGFTGYFLVEENDTLTWIANRLGCTWREIRDHPVNQWAKEKCPTWVKNQYYGGEEAIALLPRYGKTPGYDCIAPGYQAGLYGTFTNQEPVLYWGPANQGV